MHWLVHFSSHYFCLSFLVRQVVQIVLLSLSKYLFSILNFVVDASIRKKPLRIPKGQGGPAFQNGIMVVS